MLNRKNIETCRADRSRGREACGDVERSSISESAGGNRFRLGDPFGLRRRRRPDACVLFECEQIKRRRKPSRAGGRAETNVKTRKRKNSPVQHVPIGYLPPHEPAFDPQAKTRIHFYCYYLGNKSLSRLVRSTRMSQGNTIF